MHKYEKIELTNMCMIYDNDGNVVVQEKLNKNWGGITFPGGHVETGESFVDSVIREVKEETGIDVSNAGGGYVFTYQRINPEEKNNYFVDIYKFVLEFDEKDVKVQDEEVAGFEIATVEQIKAYAKQGIFLHYDSIRQVFED